MAPEVPIDWRVEPLSRLGAFHKGRGGPKRDNQDTGVPVVRYGELYTEHHEVIRDLHSFVSPERAEDYTPLRRGDLLFAGAGETADEIGKSAVFLGSEIAYTSGDTVIFRPDGELDPLFLGYASNGRAARAHKRSVGQGSSILHIYARDLETLELPVPPLPEQRRIGAILSSVDDAIAATREVVEQTRRVKQGLLQTLMTRGIGHTRFKESEIGEIPVAWEVVSLESLLADNDNAMRSGPFGSALLKRELVSEGIPLLGIDNIHEDEFRRSYTRFVSPEKAEELERYAVRPRDVVITIMGTVGRTCVVPDDIGLALSSKHIWTMTIDQRRYLPQLISLQLNWAPWVHRHFVSRSQGGIMKAIRSEVLRATPLPLPPLREQEQIASILESLEAAGIAAEREATLLDRLKHGLMQDLLTGRVRVQTA